MLDLINKIIPDVEPPKKKLDLKERLKNTLIAIFLYFLLACTPLWGVSKEVKSRFETVLILLGASFGSLITLGIGPIVTGMIILELLIGAEIIRINLRSEEGQLLFRKLMKWFALTFIIIENAVWVLGGMLPPERPSLLLSFAIILQLVAGGIILMILDDFVDKWGIGSGISLFIVAGVSRALFSQLLSPFPDENGIPQGSLLRSIFFLITGNSYAAILSLIPFLSFLIVFFLSVWAQGVTVEVPLAIARIRGYSIRWPISLLYLSNIPVIFAAALLANIRTMALSLYRSGNPLLGTFEVVKTAGRIVEVPKSGFIYYITPEPIYNVLLGRISISVWVVKAICYMIFMIITCFLFARLWIMIAPGMSPEDIAEQFTAQGTIIPGFRHDKRVIQRIISRYLYPIADLGGIFVGILAAIADILGTPVGGTSILLAVLITLNYYEFLRRQYLKEMPEWMQAFFKG